MKQEQNQSQPENPESSTSSSASPEELAALMDEANSADFMDMQGGAVDPEPKGFGADACGAMVGTCFDLLAARRGKHWQLSPAEKQTLGTATDAVLEKYLPGLGDRIGPEAALALACFAIVMPRMQADALAAAEAEAAAEK